MAAELKSNRESCPILDSVSPATLTTNVDRDFVVIRIGLELGVTVIIRVFHDRSAFQKFWKECLDFLTDARFSIDIGYKNIEFNAHCSFSDMD